MLVFVNRETGEVSDVFLPGMRCATMVEGPSMAIQSAKAECDINTIMAKYEKTGLLDHVNEYEGSYEDFSEAVDYRTALEAVAAADTMFMSLPAAIRGQFENDPAVFLDFATNPANVDKLVEMGLAKLRVSDPVPEPVKDAPPPT